MRRWRLAAAAAWSAVSALGLKGSGVDSRCLHVEPENFDGMKRSLEAGKRVQAPGGKLSIADALMAPIPGSDRV